MLCSNVAIVSDPFSDTEQRTAAVKMALRVHPDSWKLLNEKTGVIVESCIDWFNDRGDKVDTFLRILGRQEGFSLRVVDWMVTNYSKTHRLVLMFRDAPTDIHNDYHRFLNVFNKRHFDPFARRERIQLIVNNERIVFTTVGQLNFMKWFLERGLEETARSRRQDIEADMKALPHRRASHLPSAADVSGGGACVHEGPFALTF